MQTRTLTLLGLITAALLGTPAPAQSPHPTPMPLFADAIKASHGRLQLSLFHVESKATGDLAALKAHLPNHLAYLASLEANGQLFMAGPLGNDDGVSWNGDGLLIYRATDLTAARAIAEADPLHRSGARHFTIRPWLVNDGRIQLSITLSTQRLELPSP
jgi:uncharacterized protein